MDSHTLTLSHSLVLFSLLCLSLSQPNAAPVLEYADPRGESESDQSESEADDQSEFEEEKGARPKRQTAPASDSESSAEEEEVEEEEEEDEDEEEESRPKKMAKRDVVKADKLADMEARALAALQARR